MVIVGRYRIRLGSLWLSQSARVLADWTVRIVAFLQLREAAEEQRDSVWHLVTAVYILPFILLAPLNGCLNNSLPRRWVLTAAATLCLAATAAFLPDGPWIVSLGVMALGSALYSAVRYAMLPAAAQDTGLPLSTVSGWIEIGSVCSIVGGIAVGLQMSEMMDGIRLSIVVVLVLGVLAVVTALPCAFPSDPRRPEMPMQALAGFFRDCRRVLADREAGSAVLALAVFQGIITAGSGAMFTQTLSGQSEGQGNDGALAALTAVFIGLMFGAGLASLQGNPRRSLGMIPPALTGLVFAQGWTALDNVDGVAPVVPAFLLGLMGGTINVPLRATYLGSVPADARGNATSIMNFTLFSMTTAIAFAMFLFVEGGLLPNPRTQLWFLTACVAVGAILAWRVLLSNAFDLLGEFLVWPMYRIRAHGPGAGLIPRRGPLLIVANHSSYFDPFWIAGICPRHARPMMMAKFYDIRGIHWLMVNIVRAIRVPRQTFRREAPELQLAAEELKKGECILIFPEGFLRRTEAKLIKLFGQGVWHVLREAPETPVVVCWIEGGWGSYCSYKDGPPMKNKKLDFRRAIDVSILKPKLVPAEILADHRTTRRYLMQQCLEARRALGLPVPDGIVPGIGDEMEEAESAVE